MEPRPLFREEFLSGALSLVKETFLPRILGKDLRSPEDVNNLLSPFRGNRMAKAMIEIGSLGLCLQNRPHSHCRPCWAACAPKFRWGSAWVSRNRWKLPWTSSRPTWSRGYQRIKLKIKPGWDVDLIRRVREHFPEINLTVDR